MSSKKEDWLDKAVKRDLEYFEKQVNKGIRRIVGEKTKDQCAGCIHCRIWAKTEKFIKEIRKNES